MNGFHAEGMAEDEDDALVGVFKRHEPTAGSEGEGLIQYPTSQDG